MQDLGGGPRDSVCGTWECKWGEEGKVGKREKRWRGEEKVVVRLSLEMVMLGNFGMVLLFVRALGFAERRGE